MKEKINDVLIVKVGSSLLANNNEPGQLQSDTFERIGDQILELRDAGHNVALVSSGAIAAGMTLTHLAARPDTKTEIPELQRLASIGWPYVLKAWSDALPGAHIGQLLLTLQSLDHNIEREEALGVMHSLFSHGDIPVINENDSISDDEITFGDNDRLAALLACRITQSPQFTGNVHLVLLSNVDGVYKDPGDTTSVVPVIEDTARYQHLIVPGQSEFGTGGMNSKLVAASMAGQLGVKSWLANGNEENAIQRALNGEIGTYFPGKP